ncbi:Rod shape-determining protein MreD [hydrothermal vent metagenome]|uniref:Rod shape-determining protein MreD n=1 Tax=hydrothermal vent metagenome TaxID=652676 RepID=A0A3B1AMY3_9ZZZZ
MTILKHRGGGTIIISFLIAIILTIIPLPESLAYARPEWLFMVYVYWCLALPQRIGVSTGWFLGLILDVVLGTLLGQHALAFAITGYITLKVHQRVRISPLHQQALTIFMLVTTQIILINWIKGMTGNETDLWLMLLPALSTAASWPWIFLMMRFIRRQNRVA